MTSDDFYDARSSAIERHLAGGALPADRLRDLLDAEGLLEDLHLDAGYADDLDELWRATLDDEEVWIGPDDTVIGLLQLEEGLVLTHEVTADELDDGALQVVPDLPLLTWFDTDAKVTLVDHGGVVSREPDRIRGPEGWLAGVAPGDLVAVSRPAPGRLALHRPDPAGLASGSREAGLLAEAATARGADEDGTDASVLVLDALTADPGAWREPTRPVRELLIAAGVEERDGSYGLEGTAWRSDRERHRLRMLERAAEDHGLEHCCRTKLGIVADVWHEGVDAVDPVGVAASLSHGATALAFIDYLDEDLDTDPARVRAFAGHLLDAAPRSPGAGLLAARAAETDGDLPAAEAILARTVADHPAYQPAAFHDAMLLTERSDVAGALRVLHRAELDDHPLHGMLRDWQARAGASFAAVGRNDACPCGSGRKYKHCHQRRQDHPLAERADLLAMKLGIHIHSRKERVHLYALAILATDLDDRLDFEDVGELVDDPAIADFALWEGGAAAHYLLGRGSLLPDDEADLARRLLAQPRRVWEITAVEAGASLTLRDTATGREQVVTERLGSIDRRAGELVLARVVSIDGVHQMFGPVIDVPLRLRDSALRLVDDDPDDNDLTEWYGWATRPPTLANREGEPTVFCHLEATTTTPADEVRAVLARLYGPEENDRFGEWVDLDGDGRILRGAVRLIDGHLEVDTNSVERCERIMEAIAAEVDPLVVTVDERITAPELMKASRAGTDRVLAPGTPAEQAALESWIAQAELDWLDEEIPALAGLTPRQAADDPTRREDLVALLRDMEGQPLPDGAVSFDIPRLRSLLGIDA